MVRAIRNFRASYPPEKQQFYLPPSHRIREALQSPLSLVRDLSCRAISSMKGLRGDPSHRLQILRLSTGLSESLAAATTFQRTDQAAHPVLEGDWQDRGRSGG